jgi:hypothetical protein
MLSFSGEEAEHAKLLLATRVTTMMGRKLEEDDWGSVYCGAKGIPKADWSNLHLDVNFEGLGVEHKMLRCSQLNDRPIKSVCGTTLMHPSATRSIRIENTSAPANQVMKDVFQQYAELIDLRTEAVRQRAAGKKPDMRTGWLLWEDNLAEFLYFEERMMPPNPALFYSEWNETAAKGARKASRSLWIYEKSTGQKRFSVTTSAGIKIQPYFDVPAPSDPNLFYFRVQSVPIDSRTVQLWVAASTALALQRKIGDLTKENVSKAVLRLSKMDPELVMTSNDEHYLAVPIEMSAKAHAALLTIWKDAVSDEHRAQLLVKALR